MCEAPLLQSGSGSRLSSEWSDIFTKPGPATATDKKSAESARLHIKCGWPLNDGTCCNYTGRTDNVHTHRNTFAGHSRHRESLALSTNTSGIGSNMFKRARSDDAPAAAPKATSSTRFSPNPSASGAPKQPESKATTSSTRTGVFEEYSFRPPTEPDAPSYKTFSQVPKQEGGQPASANANAWCSVHV